MQSAGGGLGQGRDGNGRDGFWASLVKPESNLTKNIFDLTPTQSRFYSEKPKSRLFC